MLLEVALAVFLVVLLGHEFRSVVTICGSSDKIPGTQPRVQVWVVCNCHLATRKKETKIYLLAKMGQNRTLYIDDYSIIFLLNLWSIFYLKNIYEYVRKYDITP